MFPLSSVLTSAVQTVIIAAADSKKMSTSSTTSTTTITTHDGAIFAVIVASMISVPLIANFCKHVTTLKGYPSWTYKVIWVAAFACNLYTVGLPGRFDGQTAQASQAAKTGGKGSDSKVFNAWKTVFQPAGWAFAIWGVIYLGETIDTMYVAAVGRPADAIKAALPYWVAGNLFQSLWCFAFRERFRNRLYLPAMLLLLAGSSMAAAQRALTGAIQDLSFSAGKQIYNGASGLLRSKIGLLLFRFPISLHTGWLFAATLLNLNAWAVASKLSIAQQISCAYASTVAAVAVASGLAYTSGDPWIALTGAWAISAVAYQTEKDVAWPSTPESKAGLVSAELLARNVLVGVAVMSVLKGAGKFISV